MGRDEPIPGAVLDWGEVAVVLVDQHDFAVRWASRSARRLFGRPGRSLVDLVRTEDRPTVGVFLQIVAAGHNAASKCTCVVTARRFATRRVDLVARNLSTDPGVGGIVVVALDRIGRVVRLRWLPRSMRRLERLASTDRGTGLPSAWGYRSRFEQAFSAVPESGPGPVVLLLYLDNRRAIGDAHGDSVVDEVIRHVGSGLAAVVVGRGMAARAGAEEFEVLLDRANEEQAVAIGNELRLAIRSPLPLTRGAAVRVTASIGIAVARPGTGLDEAFRQAGSAAWQAGEAGGDRVVLYRDEPPD